METIQNESKVKTTFRIKKEAREMAIYNEWNELMAQPGAMSTAVARTLTDKSDARINSDGTLFHSLATKPHREPIPIDRPVHYQDSIVYRDKLVKEVIQVERELSWWQKTQIKGFWLLLAAFIALCGVKIIPIIRKFI